MKTLLRVLGRGVGWGGLGLLGCPVGSRVIVLCYMTVILSLHLDVPAWGHGAPLSPAMADGAVPCLPTLVEPSNTSLTELHGYP